MTRKENPAQSERTRSQQASRPIESTYPDRECRATPHESACSHRAIANRAHSPVRVDLSCLHFL